jgi:hypothetical protein
MMSDSRRRRFVALNLVGGVLVLASYAWGAFAAPETMGSLWGGVPFEIRPLYTVNMLLAAAGYFLFAPYIALRVDADRDDILGRFDYSIFGTMLFGLIMIPSALWLPLTSMMLEEPSAWVWALIRIDRALVGVGSVGLFASLWTLSRPFAPGRTAALIGLAPFCLQTALLDAVIWPAYFTQ